MAMTTGPIYSIHKSSTRKVIITLSLIITITSIYKNTVKRKEEI